MTEIGERALLDIAYEAASAAARELLRRFGHHQDGVRAKSTPTDLVSEADLAAEAAIRSVLAARRPGDSILGEEGGATGDGELLWIVDPLDGTVNFLFGNPHFAVSVACQDRHGRVAGVVVDPVRTECFAATRTGTPMLGRDLDGEPIHGSARDRLESAMVATGFAYGAGTRARQAEVVARVLPRARDIRRAGAAALDLAWCACGRYDAYYERGLHEWDLAAGALICERAGLAVRRLAENGDNPSGLAVAPPGLIDELLELVG